MISISSPVVSKYTPVNKGQQKVAPAFCAVDVSELILKGDNALNNNKPEEAILAYKEAKQKNPDTLETYRKLGKAYHNIKDYSSEDKQLIIRAYEFASVVHRGVKRKSGEDYIIHPLSVACILAEMHADADTIAAGLLHDTIEDGVGITREKIAGIFNPTIAMLVDGVTKMKKMQFNNDKKMTDDANTRKIVESIIIDVRIFIIKLADRLHNMRTLEFHKPEKQIEHAIETRELFIPFAYLIGAYNIKAELEDICFKYLEPDEYKRIEDYIKYITSAYRSTLDEVVCTISQVLNTNQVPFNIKVRIKNLYGMYQKLKQYGTIEDIHDLVAIKILLSDEESCYWVNKQLENMYEVLEEKSKDYIKIPKTNLYSALHTSIISPSGYKLQFQIKTLQMHKINAYGLTAYWNLLKNQRRLTPAQKMQDEVRKLQFFSVIKELVDLEVSNDKFNEEIKDDLLSKKIYVSTPKGDVIELPCGSTPIDFAYKIHTDIGNTIVSAVVNDEVVRLNYQLQNKDVVNIISNKHFIGPKEDYLSYCKTKQAKRKIKELKKTYYKMPNHN